MFLGKGGAGKTTLAAATAVRLAADGPVLLVSLDRAHSTTGVLGVPAGSGIRSVAPGLDLIEIDSLELLERRYTTLSTLASAVGGHDHAGNFHLPDPAEITGLPGAQDILALTEVAALADDGRWGTVIVDAPASADTFAMLTAPHTVLGYMERIWPQHSRIAAATGPDPRLAVVVALFDRILAAVDAARAVLEDRSRTDVTLVANPDRAGLSELRRLRSWTALAGLRLREVIVNGILPDLGSDDSAGRWLTARRNAQRRVLDEMIDTLVEAPVRVCAQAEDEPVGTASLGALADSIEETVGTRPNGGADDPPVRIRHDSGTGVDAVYTLRMHLPLADPSTLTLGRTGDDLVVGADGARRRIRLASGLRRCTVAGAEFDGTGLLVRFAPDPEVWPS
ncbi:MULTISPECIES: ArsA family ATPase [Rhodococcus]|uniref:ArsA family ATPase n=1 Tax=Rhodococcus TaxID=1827 RepID=UPI001CF8B719|nr:MULTISPECIES: ArsA-related P-loop ATPase [Rhodococcus]